MKELQFLMYTTPQENIKIDVVVKDETIWLTQKAMAALFGVQIPAINKHLANIYEDGELEKAPTVSILEIVQTEGNRNITRKIEFYNLYQTSKSNVSEHIKHIFEGGELDEKVVVRNFRTTTQHGAIAGKTQNIETNFYNLDLIISLGY